MPLPLPGEDGSRPRLFVLGTLEGCRPRGRYIPASLRCTPRGRTSRDGFGQAQSGLTRAIEFLLAVAVVVGLCSLGGGCATPPRSRAARVRRLPAPIVAAAHTSRGLGRAEGPKQKDEGAEFVARSLHDSGLRFGTDGSTRALWEYLRLAHRTVAAPAARPGDVLFFDTRAIDADPDCDDVTDHAGVVETVEPDGRIVFVEARRGQVRRSVVDPAHPTLRRNERGEIANTFLRSKGVADPPNARYFAGEMLCGIARPER
jgi:hypothetical protein